MSTVAEVPRSGIQQTWQTVRYGVRHPVTWIAGGAVVLGVAVVGKIAALALVAIYMISKGILDWEERKKTIAAIQKETRDIPLLEQAARDILRVKEEPNTNF